MRTRVQSDRMPAARGTRPTSPLTLEATRPMPARTRLLAPSGCIFVAPPCHHHRRVQQPNQPRHCPTARIKACPAGGGAARSEHTGLRTMPRASVGTCGQHSMHPFTCLFGPLTAPWARPYLQPPCCSIVPAELRSARRQSASIRRAGRRATSRPGCVPSTCSHRHLHWSRRRGVRWARSVCAAAARAARGWEEGPVHLWFSARGGRRAGRPRP